MENFKVEDTYEIPELEDKRNIIYIMVPNYKITFLYVNVFEWAYTHREGHTLEYTETITDDFP